MFGNIVEVRNMADNYPITAMTQSSSNSNHQFVMIRPNYLLSLEEKNLDRWLVRDARAKIHDRFYAGFFAQVRIYILLKCIIQYCYTVCVSDK